MKPVLPKPTVEAVEQGLSRPQAEMATCDADTEMDCLGDGTVCVPIAQLCDGQQQCPHGEDEDPHECAYYDGKFSHCLGMLVFKVVPAAVDLLFCRQRLLTLLEPVCRKHSEAANLWQELKKFLHAKFA